MPHMDYVNRPDKLESIIPKLDKTLHTTQFRSLVRVNLIGESHGSRENKCHRCH